MSDLFPKGAAIVFGGSAGIGRTVCAEFAKSSSDVAICYHSKKDVAEQVVDEVTKLGARASLHRIDVRKAELVTLAINDAIEKHGRIHTLVWGAGPLVPQVSLADALSDDFRNAMEIEAFGFFECCVGSFASYARKCRRFSYTFRVCWT